MTGLILILFATICVAFVTIRVLRTIGNWNVSSASLVSLSPGRGQNQRRQQKGFVHAGGRQDRRKASKPKPAAKPKLPAGAVRKPWGW